MIPKIYMPIPKLSPGLQATCQTSMFSVFSLISNEHLKLNVSESGFQIRLCASLNFPHFNKWHNNCKRKESSELTRHSKVIREDPSEEVIFEQKLEWWDGCIQKAAHVRKQEKERQGKAGRKEKRREGCWEKERERKRERERQIQESFFPIYFFTPTSVSQQIL